MLDSVDVDRNPVPLVVLDVQDAIDQPVWDGKSNPDYIENIQRFLGLWREKGWPVIHIKHDEATPTSTYHTYGPWNAIKKEVKPVKGEVIIIKQQNSAFIETDLHSTLKTMGAKQMVLTGVVIHNSMDATVRAGKALGYNIILPSDATTAVPVTNKSGQTWDARTVHDLTVAILEGEYAMVAPSAAILEHFI
ncbi:isochorismatase family protein [Flexibacterium corallicola]|uniref:isochorismatase family protein n=1 Tax=Flexibacterium corallicola TaxID=3037259 RepID=UPI00286F15ED|nr:isochorismatase family protein [Pseudovibrio sp. M1P-2-3]